METQILQSLILEVTEVWYIQGTMHLSGKFAQDSKFKFTVGFWCQTIHKKFLRRFDPIFGLKMMVKSGLEKIILRLHDGLQSCCCPPCPVQKNLLNWPGRLAGISEGAHQFQKKN